MSRVYIGVGSNLGDRRQNILRAEEALRASVESLKKSVTYETDPVGGPPQGKFLNAVWEIETRLEVDDLFAVLMKIESDLGRLRTEKNGPRPIDLDILFYDGRVIDGERVRVPHPRLHERQFVLKPLCDLNPELEHPVFKTSVKTLLENIQ